MRYTYTECVPTNAKTFDDIPKQNKRAVTVITRNKKYVICKTVPPNTLYPINVAKKRPPLIIKKGRDFNR